MKMIDHNHFICHLILGTFTEYPKSCNFLSYSFLPRHGKRGSNSRHSVLETDALPTELFPCLRLQRYYNFRYLQMLFDKNMDVLSYIKPKSLNMSLYVSAFFSIFSG